MVEGAVLVGSCSRNQLKASFLEEIKDIQLELQIGRAQGGKRAFLCMKSCLTRYIALHCLTLSYIVSQGTLLYIGIFINSQHISAKAFLALIYCHVFWKLVLIMM